MGATQLEKLRDGNGKMAMNSYDLRSKQGAQPPIGKLSARASSQLDFQNSLSVVQPAGVAEQANKSAVPTYSRLAGEGVAT